MRWRFACVLAFVFALLAAPASAESSTEALFAEGVAALQKGDYPAAIDAFEALADRGFVHPDASYDRALAYIARVRDGAERAGDLGRAAAALEETLLSRPDDADAEMALELVRAEVAKRRARSSGANAEVEAHPTIDRALVGLASERVWAVLAAFGSTLLTLGLALRRAERESSAHLAGTIAAPVGALALLAFGALAWGARHVRTTTEPAVVVAAEARLLDEKGIPKGGASIPEAAKVEIHERRGGLVFLRWGTLEGWASARELRTLPSQSR